MDWRRHWRQHWNESPVKFDKTDFFRQVGKSVEGRPITEIQFNRIVCDLTAALDLKPDDVVLDLCCGNGVITKEIALFCNTISGVDYSLPLIDVARTYHQRENIQYHCASILSSQPVLSGNARPFTKVYMYEALQHFDQEDLRKMLRMIRSISIQGVTVLLGSVPDKERIWLFYNTEQRRSEYYRRLAIGQEAIGQWWERKTVESVAASEGFGCTFIEQHPSLHTGHYRFDARLNG